MHFEKSSIKNINTSNSVEDFYDSKDSEVYKTELSKLYHNFNFSKKIEIIRGPQNSNPESELRNFLKYEFLETNLNSSFLAANILDLPTRKYHSLHTCRNILRADKVNNLVKIIYELKFDDEAETIELNPNKYLGSDLNFNTDIEISFDKFKQNQINYKLAAYNLIIKKQVVLLENEDTSLIRFSFEKINEFAQIKKFKLYFKPLFSFANYHHNQSYEKQKKITLKQLGEIYHFDYFDNENSIESSSDSSYSTSNLNLKFNINVNYQELDTWYYKIELFEEEARGYNNSVDLLCPGLFEIDLKNSQDFLLAISNSMINVPLMYLWDKNISSKYCLHSNIDSNNSKEQKQYIQELLDQAAKQFVYKPNLNEFSVIAGFHWFNEWGRDTFISLPGLFLNTNYEKTAIKVFDRFLKLIKNGLIPNVIEANAQKSQYHSVDASLWLIWAMQKCSTQWCDHEWIKENFWEHLKSIFIYYRSSRAEGVRYHENGLLDTGFENNSLSWMDAIYNGIAATPRKGFLVEINALWFNALSFMHQLALGFSDPIEEEIRICIQKVKQSFIDIFYIEKKGYLADFVDAKSFEQNQQLRPNQIFAMSLPFSVIEDLSLSKQIFTHLKNELLTPYGLRTLATNDEKFKATYAGNTKYRDYAYHNGTSWTWLIGGYVDLLLKVNHEPVERLAELREIIFNISQNFSQQCFGQLNEIFDASAPYAANGCIAQAWSIAELRRIFQYAY